MIIKHGEITIIMLSSRDLTQNEDHCSPLQNMALVIHPMEQYTEIAKLQKQKHVYNTKREHRALILNTLAIFYSIRYWQYVGQLSILFKQVINMYLVWGADLHAALTVMVLLY